MSSVLNRQTMRCETGTRGTGNRRLGRLLATCTRCGTANASGERGLGQSWSTASVGESGEREVIPPDQFPVVN